MSPFEHQLVLVVGMHRSGTSAIAHGLQILGVNLGDNLVPPRSNDNEKGFFEDSEIVRFNEELLGVIGTYTDALSFISDNDFNSERLVQYKLRAAELIRERIGVAPFGIKDPRIVRLLPFWQDVFRQENINVSYVIAVRNPMSVADSLRKRDGFDVEKSYYLWLEHMLPSIFQTENHRRVVVSFELMMAEPLVQLRRMARALNLPYDERSSGVCEYINKFLDASLQHACFNLDDLRADPSVPDDVIKLYELLVGLSIDQFDIDTPEITTRCRQLHLDLQRLVPAFNYMTRNDLRLIECRNEMVALKRHFEDSEARLVGLEQSQQVTLAALNEARNALASVYASRSWKITRPLRVVRGLVANRKVLLSRDVLGTRRVVESLRQNGFVGTIRKIGRRTGSGTSSFRYSSVLRPQLNGVHDSLSKTQDTSPKKLTLISMIKNERGIIETFAGHALAMFDRVIFIDHQSSDGSGAYMRALADEYPQIEYYMFDEPGYYQSEVMTWVVSNLIGSDEDGWVFFLDADEYLPFTSRTECDRELAKYASFPVISMPWLNLVPLDMDSGQVKGGVFMRPPKTAAHHKIAFQPGLIPFDDYVVAQGNHALLVGKGYRQIFPAEEAFPIYHLPIRAKQQLRDKIRHGVESYRKMGVDRGENLGFHWDDINQLMEDNGLTDDLMADMISRYGEPMVPPYGKSLNAMVQEGYAEIKLDICTDGPQIRFQDCIEEQRIDSCVSGVAGEPGNRNSRRELPIVLDSERRTLKFRCG